MTADGATGKGAAGEGIGARVRRKEDTRHLHGHGCFVADIAMPGLREVAFLRSPVAHGRIVHRAKPPGFESAVFFGSDLAGVSPITTRSSFPGYKLSDYPSLAAYRVRFVGEAVAI